MRLHHKCRKYLEELQMRSKYYFFWFDIHSQLSLDREEKITLQALSLLCLYDLCEGAIHLIFNVLGNLTQQLCFSVFASA